MELNLKIIKVSSPQQKSEICKSLLRSLPLWFGIESAIQDYVNDVQEMDTWSAEVDGKSVGFISINKHNQFTAEIHVMAVLEQYHGQSIGTKLIQVVERVLATEGFKFLQVKTLSESRPNVEYDKTRKFYLKYGFTPVEEFKTLWGPANPCLLLIKALASYPQKIVSAGVILWNSKNELLVVKPSYKELWEIPGGICEKSEAPSEAVVREVAEELSIKIEKRIFPLVIDWGINPTNNLEVIHFIFEGGVLSDDLANSFVLQKEELLEYRFIQFTEVKKYLGDRLGGRVFRAIDSKHTGKISYMEMDR